MPILTLSEFAEAIRPFAEALMKFYWKPIRDYLDVYPVLARTVPGFLVHPEKVIFYFGKTHLGIEYVGPERIDELPSSGFTVQFGAFDYTLSQEDFLEQIIGFSYDDSSAQIDLALPPLFEGLLWPTNSGLSKLDELNWHFDAQDFVMAINTRSFSIPQGQFCRIVNGLFFDADDSGLKTRHVKWLDLVPLMFYDDSGDRYDRFGISFAPYEKLVEADCNYIYPLPEDFKGEKLAQINRFIELVANDKTTELQMTRLLSEERNNFILSMRFGAETVHSELACEWQSEDRESIRPDFFVVQPNGYGDIVEFKLPKSDSSSVVGRANRETFSAVINSYVSQTRVYRAYFEDPNNRKWFESKYGFKVYKPKRILVIGRRWHFPTEEWKEIASDYQDLDIITYDDLIDGVVAQFYM